VAIGGLLSRNTQLGPRDGDRSQNRLDVLRYGRMLKARRFLRNELLMLSDLNRMTLLPLCDKVSHFNA
jgi:hypothetical protein